VQSLQFNVLVTTYEFIMRDRSRLSKVGSTHSMGSMGSTAQHSIVGAVPATWFDKTARLHDCWGL